MTRPEQLADAGARPGLRERKAFATKRRLLAAALDLMAREGSDGVTIAILADRSDIAVGTFYNYFSSRESIIEAVIDLEVGTMGRRLDALIASIADPADAFSAVLRHLVRSALNDPVWGWLIVRLGPESQAVGDIFGRRLESVLEAGRRNGRFLVTDVSTAAAVALGSLLAALRAYLEQERAPGEAATEFTESQLRAAGLGVEEAARIAARRLPELPVIADQGALSIARIPL